MISFSFSGRLTSPDTPHFAEPLSRARDEWQVSWLPGNILTRNQAVSAIMLAAHVATPAPVNRALLETWARELGLDPDDARTISAMPVLPPPGPTCPCGFGARCFGTPAPESMQKLPSEQTPREQIASHLWAAHHLRAVADRTAIDGSTPATVVKGHIDAADQHLRLADEKQALIEVTP